jgi:glycosyltransferase involved in cell wall biosynthesis
MSLVDFSIIVPVHNMFDTIGPCIESLVSQNYEKNKFEIIVVDNMSTDSTRDIVKKYPVTLLDETVYQSSYAARNTGIKNARGKCLAFTDADCVADPNWLIEIAKRLNDTEIGCFAGEIYSYPPTTLTERFSENIGLLRQKGPVSGWHFKPYAQTANAVYRAEVFEKIGYFHPSMKSGGDADIAWRMQEKTDYKLLFVPEAKIYHKHRVDASELYKQFRRYGTGKLSWKTFHNAFKLPHVADMEADYIKAMNICLAALQKAEAGEVDVIYPVLRTFTQAAHLIGYLQEIARAHANDPDMERIVQAAPNAAPHCNICGGLAFKPGPNNRLNFGHKPMCMECGSLERHRVMQTFFAALPQTVVEGRKALIVGEPLRFGLNPFVEITSNDGTSANLPFETGRFDWVVSNTILHRMDDDAKALDELVRCCTPGGIIQIFVPEPNRRLRTTELSPTKPRDPVRAYGSDFSRRLLEQFPHLHILIAFAEDSVTTDVESFYLLSADDAILAAVEAALRRGRQMNTVTLN